MQSWSQWNRKGVHLLKTVIIDRGEIRREMRLIYGWTFPSHEKGITFRGEKEALINRSQKSGTIKMLIEAYNGIMGYRSVTFVFYKHYVKL